MLEEAFHVNRHTGTLHVEADWQRSVTGTEHVADPIRDWVEQTL